MTGNHRRSPIFAVRKFCTGCREKAPDFSWEDLGYWIVLKLLMSEEGRVMERQQSYPLSEVEPCERCECDPCDCSFMERCETRAPVGGRVAPKSIHYTGGGGKRPAHLSLSDLVDEIVPDAAFDAEEPLPPVPSLPAFFARYGFSAPESIRLCRSYANFLAAQEPKTPKKRARKGE